MLSSMAKCPYFKHCIYALPHVGELKRRCAFEIQHRQNDNKVIVTVSFFCRAASPCSWLHCDMQSNIAVRSYRITAWFEGLTVLLSKIAIFKWIHSYMHISVWSQFVVNVIWIWAFRWHLLWDYFYQMSVTESYLLITKCKLFLQCSSFSSVS